MYYSRTQNFFLNFHWRHINVCTFWKCHCSVRICVATLCSSYRTKPICGMKTCSCLWSVA